LTTHIFHWFEKMPEYLDISISYSNVNTPSDNIAVSLTSPNHDLINLVFTSRSEPFEGVNETINFQHGELTVKVDDFRIAKVWNGASYKEHKYWPKNNGHKAAVLQPFSSDRKRNWSEVEYSTKLMLFIEEMVLSNISNKIFKD